MLKGSPFGMIETINQDEAKEITKIMNQINQWCIKSFSN